MSDNTLLTNISKGASAVASLGQYLWETNSDNTNTSLVADPQMIALSDALGGVLHGSKIDIPQIVVVGTQSSGKSSVLNSLIGLDILPTGKQMVTRTPLHLEIVRAMTGPESSSVAEFGSYTAGVWEPTVSHSVTFPRPTLEEQTRIEETIQAETCRLAGSRCDVSETPIHLRIVSPHVTNLSFVDLPGLTAVACRDRGQPADIKERIQRLVGSFAEKPSTLILAVMPGRSDLEADMGLELVKQHDPEGRRTVGILTKLDLMNDPTDTISYLKNSVSRDLQLQHGYFAVRNRSSAERETLSATDGLERERRYFTDSPVFRKAGVSSRLGCPALKGYLAGLLTEATKTHLPNIQAEITQQLGDLEVKLARLGEALPKTPSARTSYLHTLLANFCREAKHSITDRGSAASTGRNIRDMLVRCREQLVRYNAFQPDTDAKMTTTDADMEAIIQNSEGNHMSFPYPPVEILERCLQDRDRRPLRQLLDPLQFSTREVTKELTQLIHRLLEESPIARFPELHKQIRQDAVHEVIVPNSVTTLKSLEEMIHMQEDYIWSDDTEFRQMLLAFGRQEEGVAVVPALRSLLAQYISSVAGHLQDTAPKAIMYHLVHASMRAIYETLYARLSEADTDALLVEDTELEQQRREWSQTRDSYIAALATIGKFT